MAPDKTLFAANGTKLVGGRTNKTDDIWRIIRSDDTVSVPNIPIGIAYVWKSALLFANLLTFLLFS